MIYFFMDLKTKSKIIYSLKIFIPIIIVIAFFIGGVSSGIISFEHPNRLTGKITASIIIDFGDGTNYSNIITVDNSTVFDFLLEIEKIGDIVVESNEVSGNYEIESITYKGKEYIHGKDGNWWLFYINEQFAQDSADKVYVNNDDLIEWKYENF